MRIKLPSNDVNREQPAFLIFPMFVILTWLSANIHQNYVKNIQFTELFPMHTLQWSTILPEMLLQQIHGSTQSHVPRGETWPCQPAKITPFQWRSWLLRLYSVVITLQVSFKTWSFYQKLNNLQTRSKQLFVSLLKHNNSLTSTS